MSFWREVRRRNAFKFGVFYTIVAWMPNLLFISSCTSSGEQKYSPNETVTERPITQREITRIVAKEFSFPNAQIPRHFNLKVRPATEFDTEEIRKLRSDAQSLVTMELGIAALGVVEAFVLPGFFSGSLIAGAIFIAPTAIILNEIDRRTHNIIMRTLQEISLVDLTRMNLEKHLPRADASVTEVPEVELVIVGYGFTNQVCLFADAVIIVKVQGDPVYEDVIYLEPFLRSSDSPPPICGTLQDFAKDNGHLIKNGFIEYGQVLAAIVRKRTKVLPWKE